jgi:hypothetical protein
LRDIDVTATDNQRLPQQLSDVVWACAELRKQASVDDIQLMLQTLVHPAVLANMNSQNIANTCRALRVLQQLPVWDAAINEQLLGKLLAKPQLQVLSASGDPLEVSQVVVAIAHLASANVIPTSFAQECVICVLNNSCVLLGGSDGLSLSELHIMGACAELGLVDLPFRVNF